MEDPCGRSFGSGVPGRDGIGPMGWKFKCGRDGMKCQACTSKRKPLTDLEDVARRLANTSLHDYAKLIRDAEDSLTELKAKNERLRADGERLDWLEAQTREDPSGRNYFGWNYDWRDTLREAIDSARTNAARKAETDEATT